MPEFEPLNPNYEIVVRKSFEFQSLMRNFGARLVSVKPGEVLIELPYREDLTQQHGYLHAGVITALIDSACGYAALSLMPPQKEVLSAEYKINLLSPADGEVLLAKGMVIKPGKNLYVCRGDAFSVKKGSKKHVAVLQGTMVAVKEIENRD